VYAVELVYTVNFSLNSNVSNGRQVTPVNSNTPIIRTNFMSPWVFEFSRFYCTSKAIHLEILNKIVLDLVALNKMKCLM